MGQEVASHQHGNRDFANGGGAQDFLVKALGQRDSGLASVFGMFRLRGDTDEAIVNALTTSRELGKTPLQRIGKVLKILESVYLETGKVPNALSATLRRFQATNSIALASEMASFARHPEPKRNMRLDALCEALLPTDPPRSFDDCNAILVAMTSLVHAGVERNHPRLATVRSDLRTNSSGLLHGTLANEILTAACNGDSLIEMSVQTALYLKLSPNELRKAVSNRILSYPKNEIARASEQLFNLIERADTSPGSKRLISAALLGIGNRHPELIKQTCQTRMEAVKREIKDLSREEVGKAVLHRYCPLFLVAHQRGIQDPPLLGTDQRVARVGVTALELVRAVSERKVTDVRFVLQCCKNSKITPNELLEAVQDLWQPNQEEEALEFAGKLISHCFQYESPSVPQWHARAALVGINRQFPNKIQRYVYDFFAAAVGKALSSPAGRPAAIKRLAAFCRGNDVLDDAFGRHLMRNDLPVLLQDADPPDVVVELLEGLRAEGARQIQRFDNAGRPSGTTTLYHASPTMQLAIDVVEQHCPLIGSDFQDNTNPELIRLREDIRRTTSNKTNNIVTYKF